MCLLGRSIVLDRPEGLQEVCVARFGVLACGSSLGDGKVKLPLLSRAELPLLHPRVQALELRSQCVVVARLLDQVHNRKEDVVAGLVIGLDGVEDRSQDSERDSSAVCGRGSDGLGEELADGREVGLGVF